jgi:hypothetical protein
MRIIAYRSLIRNSYRLYISYLLENLKESYILINSIKWISLLLWY